MPYEECLLLGCDIMWFLLKPTFRRKTSSPLFCYLLLTLFITHVFFPAPSSFILFIFFLVKIRETIKYTMMQISVFRWYVLPPSSGLNCEPINSFVCHLLTRYSLPSIFVPGDGKSINFRNVDKLMLDSLSRIGHLTENIKFKKTPKNCVCV
jgi:hypothetical protein